MTTEKSRSAAGPPLLVTRPSPGIVVATLNRPHRRNALTEDSFRMLAELCAGLRTDPRARVLVLDGAGDSFSSGYDIDEIGRIAALPPPDLLDLLERHAEAVTGLRALPQAVLVAADGASAGAGLSLALAADIRVSTTRAFFQASFVSVGLSGGDMGASWLLPRVTSFGFANEMMLTGRSVPAAEAYAHGLVNRLTSPEDLRPAALALAGEIAGNSPTAVALTKRVLQANVDAPSLEDALAREAPLQVVAAGSAPVRRAVAAFRARRAGRETTPNPEERHP
ncbi:enoyl-CoA hydratase/isomerase family protein [Streptomyces sp. NPDC088116]|uniref:enoyl-CoA hydratase/isomerase family protein n=1 Tax=Streptomyces sp. NPDC088116 TaxID=3365825 RepID=UPI00382CB1A1